MSNTVRSLTLATALACAACFAADARADGWRDKLKSAARTVASSPAATNALSQSDVAAGLKEALANGASKAVNELGRSDGFWASKAYRIPLPSSLARGEALLRQLGQGAKVDAFQLSLNRAAEQAVPVAADLVGDAIRNMTLADAQAILAGGDDAATQYFRRQAGEALRARMLPLVAESTGKVGVTKRYKDFTSANGGGLLALANQFGGKGGAVDANALDLDGYVTDKALDALFDAIAAQEREIRRNPAARGSDLLRKVFGG